METANFCGSLMRYTATHLRNTMVNLHLLSNLELYISECCTNANWMTFKISYYVKLIIWFIPFLTPAPSRIWLWKAIPVECPHWCSGGLLLYSTEHEIPSPNLPAPVNPRGNAGLPEAKLCKTTPLLREVVLGRDSQQLGLRTALQNMPASLWHSSYEPSPNQAPQH